MSKLQNSLVSRTLVGVLALGMVFAFSGFVGVNQASAQSIDDLLAQIAALQAQLEALQGGSGSGVCPYTWTRSLSSGSTGEDVRMLQMFLNDNGFQVAASGAGSPGAESSYYGPLTASAVSAFQVANAASVLTPLGLSSGTGYFGPSSRAAANAQCVSAPSDDGDDDDDSGDSGDLEGGAGSISDADFVSSLNSEEVGEDEEDVEVAGLDIEADEGSDLELMAVRLDFDQVSADNDFEDYADEVSLWFDGDEVGRFDGDSFDDDNNYDRTVTLDRGAIIRAGERGELVLAVSGVGNIDSGDVGETWTVEFESVRYRDASGAIITDSATGDINGVTRTFSFESFATASDAKLVIAETDNDAVNKAHMINVHASNKTSNVALLEFTLEAEGDSDLTFREFGVDLVTSATDVDDVISGGTSPAVRLELDGEEYGTASYHETAANNREILFDDVDFTIEAGDEITGRILVDLLAISGALTEGDTILAQITSTQTGDTDIFDVRDETNEMLTAATDISGTATGEANQVYDVTFVLDSDGWSNGGVTNSGLSGADDAVQFTLDFDVTADDGDVYIDQTCTEGGTTANHGFSFSTSSVDHTFTCSYVTKSGATASGTQHWLVQDGETESFSVTVNTSAASADGFARVIWESLGWSEADEDGDRLYEGALDDTYLSKSVYLENN